MAGLRARRAFEKEPSSATQRGLLLLRWVPGHRIRGSLRHDTNFSSDGRFSSGPQVTASGVWSVYAFLASPGIVSDLVLADEPLWKGFGIQARRK